METHEANKNQAQDCWVYLDLEKWTLTPLSAAALDSAEPSGKSAGRGLASVTPTDAFLVVLFVISRFLTINCCNTYSLCEPCRESAVFGVGFERRQ